jgi:hypothetical protein
MARAVMVLRLAAAAAFLLSAVHGAPPMAPVAVLVIPDSIDGTGATDAAAALAEFIDAAPDGSTISFPAGKRYRLDSGLHLLDRSGLTFDGNASTLVATATTGEPGTSPFLIDGGADLTIRNLTLLGTNPDADTTSSHHLDRQNQGGVNAYGVRGLTLEGLTIRETWGDCVYLGADGAAWSERVTFRDSSCERNGRMGVAIVAARDVLVERVHLDAIALFPFDIEPDADTGGAIGVVFQDNTVGTYGRSNLFTPYFFAAEGAAGATVRDVTVTRNRVTGGTLASTADRPNRSDFTFTDNESLVPADGPVLRFAAVDGLTLRDNVQPLVSGSLEEPPGLGLRSIALMLVSIAILVAAAVLPIRRRRDPPASGTAPASTRPGAPG